MIKIIIFEFMSFHALNAYKTCSENAYFALKFECESIVEAMNEAVATYCSIATTVLSKETIQITH